MLTVMLVHSSYLCQLVVAFSYMANHMIFLAEGYCIYMYIYYSIYIEAGQRAWVHLCLVITSNMNGSLV